MLVRICVGFSQIVRCTQQEWNVAVKSLSYAHKKAHFQRRAGSGWNGKTCLLTAKGQFPTGLGSDLATGLKRVGFQLDIESAPLENPLPPPLDPRTVKLKGVELNPDQLRVVESGLACGFGIWDSAVASGKTEMAMMMTKCLGTPRTLILQNRKNLVEQTAGRFEDRLGITCGRIMEGNIDLNHSVVVATVQTLFDQTQLFDKWIEKTRVHLSHPKGTIVKDEAGRSLYREIQKVHKVVLSPGVLAERQKIRQWLSGVRLLLIDELHNSKAKQYRGIADLCVNAGYRIGMSGTPDNGDELDFARIRGITGPIVDGITVDDQIKKERSAKPLFFFRDIGRPDRVSDLYDSFWPDIYRKGVVEDPQTVQYCREAKEFFEREKMAALILVEAIDHGERLAAALQIPFLYGGTPMSTRMKTLDDLKHGRRYVIVASTIFDEGVDLPELHGVVLAGQSASPRKLTQRMGRVLRKKPHHNVAYILDFINYRHPKLFKQSMARVKHWGKIENVWCFKPGASLRKVDPSKDLLTK